MMKKQRPFSSMYSNTVLKNDAINIVHDACKICWDQRSENNIQSKLNYILKRIKTGHESVIEHSNLVMYLRFDTKYLPQVADVLQYCKYLNTKMKIINNNIHLLIGGSIRGYKNIFRTADDLSNIVIQTIRNELYSDSYKEFFIDFIQAGIMDEKFFTDKAESEYNEYGQLNESSMSLFVPATTNKITIVNCDNIKYLFDNLPVGIFDYSDLLDMCTVTILFKNMSRAATHQLVRHRNAITQESQRYVDYSNGSFASPDEFKDIYNDKKYDITIKDTKFDNISMQELGDALTDIYGQLREQEVLKEDARAFLPSNIKCQKLYMTFTYRSLIKFLELRMDKAAQAEIRSYAEIIEKEFSETVTHFIGDIYKYLIPKYQLSEVDYDYSMIDEPVEE